MQGSLMRDLRDLKEELLEKDKELDLRNNELEWCREKVARLEDTVQAATQEISRQAEECSRWEYRV